MDADAIELACLARLRRIVPARGHRDPGKGVPLATLAAADQLALAGSIGKLLARLATVAPFLPALPGLAAAAEPALPPCLVHGALSAATILVRRAGARWRIAAVIDWRHARSGSPLEDIGSLLRELDGEPFRAAFERGYRAGRGRLPAGWAEAARSADARVREQLARSVC